MEIINSQWLFNKTKCQTVSFLIVGKLRFATYLFREQI